jgi:hypothetical protein
MLGRGTVGAGRPALPFDQRHRTPVLNRRRKANQAC